MAENVPKLGALISGPAERDAVHVAVVPCIARQQLKPGQHVNAAPHHAQWVCAPVGGEPIGVVDPFLKAPVKRGDEFYLFLYPGSVVSLRHHYRHPVLDAEEIRRETMELLNAPAVEYIKECADIVDMPYDRLMEVARCYLETGEAADVNMEQSNNAMDIDWPKFWASYFLLTGKEPKDKQAEPFNCAC